MKRKKSYASCPFFKCRMAGCILCEGGAMLLDGKASDMQWRKYCADVDRWRKCVIAASRLARYGE